MQKCDLLIKGADVLISSGELRENVDIAIADGRILAVDADLAEQYEADETLDGRYKLFMPGAGGQPHAYRAAAVKGPGSGR